MIELRSVEERYTSIAQHIAGELCKIYRNKLDNILRQDVLFYLCKTQNLLNIDVKLEVLSYLKWNASN